MLVSLLVCLIPTTIGALLSAIGIAGMDRLVQRNVLAMSGRAVEAAGDVNTLLLDKTGTITLGNRQASELLPVGDADEAELADAAQLSSLADETPEGRSVVVLAKERYGLRARQPGELAAANWVPFSAQTRMSGVDLPARETDGAELRVRKGAAAAVLAWVRRERRRADRRCGSDRGWDQRSRRYAARCRRSAARRTGARPRRDLPQRRRQDRHERALRRDATDGHPYGHDHRRQPA